MEHVVLIAKTRSEATACNVEPWYRLRSRT